MRAIKITGAACGTFSIALVDGSDEAFAKAVAARSGLPVHGFFLTSGDRNDAVVPLTATLPEAITELYIHEAVRASEADKPIVKRRFSETSGEEITVWTTQREEKKIAAGRWRGALGARMRQTQAPAPAPATDSTKLPVVTATLSPSSTAKRISFSLNDSLVDADYSRYGVERRHMKDAGYGEVMNEMLNLLAAVVLSGSAMMTYFSAIGCLLATVVTWLYWENAQQYSASIDWNIISLTVILPTGSGIRMAYRRRESALHHLANLQANLRELWGAFHYWKIPTPDKSFKSAMYAQRDAEQIKDGQAAVDQVVGQFLAAMVTYFQMPRYRRARHVALGINRFHGGRDDATMIESITHEQNLLCITCISNIQKMVQDMKLRGLDGGQTHRLDQYVSKVAIAFDHLVFLKEYRTPQLFRAFARIFTLTMPIMYAPYYCELAIEAGGAITLAIVLSCLMQLTLSGLLELMLGLEDPFSGKKVWTLSTRWFDVIDIAEQIEVLRRQLVRIRREADLPMHMLAVREDW